MTEERSDTKDLDEVWDRDFPLWVSVLTIEEVVELKEALSSKLN